MNSNLVKRYHITLHATLDDGTDCVLSEARGGPVSDTMLMKIAHRSKMAIKAAWPDWVPVQEPVVRMNWLHQNSMVIG